jgi:hypothetical protein
MTQEDEEHQELQKLFDGTADAAPGPTLTKLAARAADIPERARAARFLPSWAWGPALGGVALALGALLALRASHPVEPQRGGQTAALSSAVPAVSVAQAASASAEPGANGGGETSPDDAPSVDATRTAANDETGDNLELLGDADEGAHFDVTGPQSDRDLDAWLAATKELSGGT